MTKIGDIWDGAKGFKPAILMVVLQMTYTGINVLYKLAVNDGMNLRVVIAYRYMFATAFIAPLAIIVERLINSIFYTHAGTRLLRSLREFVKCVCVKHHTSI